MKFKFLSDEIDGTLNLINRIFGISAKKENFKLLDNQRMLLLKDDDDVIGCTLITLRNDPIKNMTAFHLDYVCISEDYQRQGLGKKLFEQVERIAREENIDSIQLTSNKSRTVARNLYFDEGMEIVDTDLFIKKLK